MSDDVYILGIDMIKFGRFPNKTVPELAAESILLALDDANLNMGDMEAFYCGNIKEVNRKWISSVAKYQYQINHLILQPIEYITIHNLCHKVFNMEH